MSDSDETAKLSENPLEALVANAISEVEEAERRAQLNLLSVAGRAKELIKQAAELHAASIPTGQFITNGGLVAIGDLNMEDTDLRSRTGIPELSVELWGRRASCMAIAGGFKDLPPGRYRAIVTLKRI